MPEPDLDAARRGDHAALEAIYLQLHAPLVAFVRARGAPEPEDLATDVFLELARALPRFEGGWDRLRGLAFTIARRRLIDGRRKRTRRGTDPSPPEHLEAYLGTTGAADAAVGDDAVRRLVAGLPPDQAEVILLRVVADLSVEETARIVGKRAGAVRALQLRGLRRLARTLAPETEDHDP